MGFPGGSVVKNQCQAEDMGFIPGLGRSPGEGTSNPLQYSCLGNPMDRGAWRAAVYGGHKESHDSGTKHTHTHDVLSSECIFQICVEFLAF